MQQQNKAPLYLEIIGWFGPVGILGAFALVSFGVVDAQSYTFQLLNLVGCFAIIAISVYKKVYQSVALNGIMVIISLIAIAQLVLK